MHKKIIFATLLISLVATSDAASASDTQNSIIQASITGSIVLSGIYPHYNGSRYKESSMNGVVLHRKLLPRDILVKVCITTENAAFSSSPEKKSSEQLTNPFPPFLPVYLLEGKKEGGILDLVIRVRQSMVAVKLRCTNNQQCFAAGKNFEDSLKTILSNCPDYDSDDEELLISCGAINKQAELKK